MVAVVEVKERRAPYKTKHYWKAVDSELAKKFPLGEQAKCHRGRGWSTVKILSMPTRGRIEVLNMVTGAQYWANAECMIPPSAKSPTAMQAAIAQEHAQARTRPSVVQLFLEPISRIDARSEEARAERAQQKLMPLSSDELISYTALKAVCKTLSHLHSNADSFRDPKLFSLVQSSHILLSTVTKEMEAYRELPADA